MKLKFLALLILSISFIFPSAQALACTGYAVYSDTVYYGMNFDYPNVPISFNISDSDGMKVFHMDFKEGSYFYPTVGMNSDGVFASCQMLYPDGTIVSTVDKNKLSISSAFYNAIFKKNSVNDLEELVNSKTLVNQYRSLHTLIADPSSNAMVLEAGKDKNLVTSIGENSFLVMTNFFNSSITDQGSVSGVGSDRYRTAYDYISQNIDTFDYDKAFSVLEATVQTGSYQTQSSLVFIPEKSEVYITLKRDFNKIWKVDLKEGSLKTYSGFSEETSYNIDGGSIMMEDLINPPVGVSGDKLVFKEKPSPTAGIYIISGAVLVLVGLAAFLIIRRCKANKAFKTSK